MQKYFNNVADNQGNAISGADVTVTTTAGLLATIYSDNASTPQANPIPTDQNGYFAFYAADGRYNITISGARINPSIVITDILLEDQADGFASLLANDGTTKVRGTWFDGVIALVSDLATSAGGTLIGFIQPALNAVSRSISSKLWDKVSALDFMTYAQRQDVINNVGSINVASAYQAAVAYMKLRGGGEIEVPVGTSFFSTSNINNACVWIDSDNIKIRGAGRASIVKVAQNTDIPFHVSTIQNVLNYSFSASPINNFEISDVCIKGSGVYAYAALSYGIGVLIRDVIGASVHNCYIYDMSMIGVATAGGLGNYQIKNNVFGNCKYSAFNFNGRCYQSVASSNICYGSDGDPAAVAIQADGHCIINNNTVFGSMTNHANCGGIMWGEGNYDGIGSISGNLIKHCRYGIKAVYHGSCNITGNTVINCMTTSGIILIGGTTGGFTVASSDNIVSNNLMINNYPAHIESSAANTLITGNRLRTIAAPTNPSASSQPDYIVSISPEYAINVSENGSSVIGNIISGATRGIAILEGKTLNVVQSNDMFGVGAGNVVVVAANSAICATYNLIERYSNGAGNFQSITFGPTKPTQGFWRTGDTWNRIPMGVGLSMGETVIVNTDTTTTASAIAGATSITTAAPPSAATGNIIGIQLDNGQYHWTTVTSVAGATVNISAAIPVGRSVPNGAKVYGQQWRPLPNLT